MKIVDVETELGNRIIASLKADGWRVAKEYSLLAFDKGIDFDSYVLKKRDAVLEFEWTNWFEWEITGDQESLQYLADMFQLKIR